METTALPISAPATPKAPTCGGCFKPVDPATSLKRPIHTTAAFHGRYKRALAEPVTLHYCNLECRQKADNLGDTGRRFRF